jgi:hypothetical protein
MIVEQASMEKALSWFISATARTNPGTYSITSNAQKNCILAVAARIGPQRKRAEQAATGNGAAGLPGGRRD